MACCHTARETAEHPACRQLIHGKPPLIWGKCATVDDLQLSTTCLSVQRTIVITLTDTAAPHAPRTILITNLRQLIKNWGCFKTISSTHSDLNSQWTTRKRLSNAFPQKANVSHEHTPQNFRHDRSIPRSQWSTGISQKSQQTDGRYSTSSNCLTQ